MSWFGLILHIIIVAVLEFSHGVDYCNLRNCGSFHTLCTYPDAAPARACIQYEGSLSEEAKQTILKVHNTLRQNVASGQEMRGQPGPQPAAKEMPNLEWDDELATIAQRWADQCSYGHDRCRDSERFYVGQNVGLGLGDDQSLFVEDIVNNFYNEVQYFNSSEASWFNTVFSTDGRQISHYTQMVWVKTTKIGCGLSRFIYFNIMKSNFLVCDYGPGGNIVGEPVYEVA